jgi:hypothetical protein
MKREPHPEDASLLHSPIHPITAPSHSHPVPPKLDDFPAPTCITCFSYLASWNHSATALLVLTELSPPSIRTSVDSQPLSGHGSSSETRGPSSLSPDCHASHMCTSCSAWRASERVESDVRNSRGMADKIIAGRVWSEWLLLRVREDEYDLVLVLQ